MVLDIDVGDQLHTTEETRQMEVSTIARVRWMESEVELGIIANIEMMEETRGNVDVGAGSAGKRQDKLLA